MSFLDKIKGALQQWERDAEEQRKQREANAAAQFLAAADRFINGYGPAFHCKDRQYERFQRACSDATIGSVVSLDKKKLCFKIRSSNKQNVIYDTTLTSCTCTDFTTSMRPCKHIYKLALELGIVGTDWDISGIPAELKQRIEALPFDDRQDFVKLIISGTSSGSFEVKKRAVPASLVECGFVIIDTNYRKIIEENYSKNDIIAALALAKSSFVPNSKTTRREMIDWIIENDNKILRKLCNKHYYVSFSPSISPYLDYICRYYKYLID